MNIVRASLKGLLVEESTRAVADAKENVADSRESLRLGQVEGGWVGAWRCERGHWLGVYSWDSREVIRWINVWTERRDRKTIMHKRARAHT
jgi:hypothetical protein